METSAALPVHIIPQADAPRSGSENLEPDQVSFAARVSRIEIGTSAAVMIMVALVLEAVL